MDPIEEAEAQAEKKTAIEDFAQARVAGHGAWTPWTHDARVALTRARQAGCTLDELGQVAGVTRARIYQVLLETNDPTYRERYNAMERSSLRQMTQRTENAITPWSAPIGAGS